MARSDAEIQRLLEKTASAAASDINRLAGSKIGAIVRRGQLRQAERAMFAALARFWVDAGDTIRANRYDAAVAAFDASFNWDEPLFERAGLSTRERNVMRAGLLDVSDRNVELMIRRFTTQQIPLSRQVYQTKALSNRWVDGLINRAIGRGLSARELAGEVRRFIKPTVPGGISYAAMRLGRTELNNAFHAAAISASIDKPWVTGIKWNLSGSHPRADVCDELAGEDRFARGSGVFPRNEVPRKPHPQCFCYTVPISVDEDEFVAAFLRGNYDSYLSKNYR